MDNPGVFTLAPAQIGVAAGPFTFSPIIDLDGMTAVTLEANFQYGSGGTTCSAIVATSFDGGTTWRHIARFDFTTAADVKVANLSGLTPVGIADNAYVDLATESIRDGLLGDRLCAIIVSTGTYVNTTLSVRAAVR
jgi:hypothetical protein